MVGLQAKIGSRQWIKGSRTPWTPDRARDMGSKHRAQVLTEAALIVEEAMQRLLVLPSRARGPSALQTRNLELRVSTAVPALEEIEARMSHLEA
jgi:hypothetical protein